MVFLPSFLPSFLLCDMLFWFHIRHFTFVLKFLCNIFSLIQWFTKHVWGFIVSWKLCWACHGLIVTPLTFHFQCLYQTFSARLEVPRTVFLFFLTLISLSLLKHCPNPTTWTWGQTFEGCICLML
jgi:hypothetical protein